MLYDFHKTLLKQLQKMRVKLRYIFEIRCKDSKNFLIVQIKNAYYSHEQYARLI